AIPPRPPATPDPAPSLRRALRPCASDTTLPPGNRTPSPHRLKRGQQTSDPRATRPRHPALQRAIGPRGPGSCPGTRRAPPHPTAIRQEPPRATRPDQGDTAHSSPFDRYPGDEARMARGGSAPTTGRADRASAPDPAIFAFQISPGARGQAAPAPAFPAAQV